MIRGDCETRKRGEPRDLDARIRYSCFFFFIGRLTDMICPLTVSCDKDIAFPVLHCPGHK